MKFNVNIRYKVINIDSCVSTIQKNKRHIVLLVTVVKGRPSNQQSPSTSGKNNLVTREWLWTCITRVTDFRNVYFFKNDSEDDRMHGLLLRNYLKKNIDGYKVQDFKAGRHINARNCVNVRWC